MQEVKIKNNTLGLAVYIEEYPDLSLIPSTELNLLITDLEKEIMEYVEKRMKRKKYTKRQ
ncbi:MAG: hypothetical protein K2L70_00055 [Clostridia bacterium]|nr:hypothetical protein [Clostridia bacterium]